MPTDNLFTPEIIGVIIGILVPFGTAVFALGVQHNKISTLQSDVKELKTRVYDLSLKFETDLLARKAQEERRRIKKTGEESRQ